MVTLPTSRLSGKGFPARPGRTRGGGAPPPAGGGQPRRTLLLRQVRAEFTRLLTVPPQRTEFRHDLQYRLASEFYSAGETAVCALARLLEAEVYWREDQRQRATRTDIFTCLTDATGRVRNEVAEELLKK